MHHRLLFIAVVFFFSQNAMILTSTVNAQITPLQQSSRDIDDDLEIPDLDDDEKPAFAEDDELSYSSLELREAAEFGVALAMGASLPWQNLGLDIKYQTVSGLTLDWQTGYMEGYFANRRDDVAYNVDFVSLSSYVGVQWFFSNALPVYIEPLVGVVRWEGKMRTMGTIDQGGAAPLPATFVCAAPFFGVGIGLLQVWSSGWFIEYALLGTGVAWTLLEKSFTPSDAVDQSLVADTLTRASTWGLINLKIGYFF